MPFQLEEHKRKLEEVWNEVKRVMRQHQTYNQQIHSKGHRHVGYMATSQPCVTRERLNQFLMFLHSTVSQYEVLHESPKSKIIKFSELPCLQQLIKLSSFTEANTLSLQV